MKTFDLHVPRSIGGPEMCRFSADSSTTFHPISVFLGSACVVLEKSDALRWAHALVSAVQSLPKGK